ESRATSAANSGIRDSGFGIRSSGFGIRSSGFGIRDWGFGNPKPGAGSRKSGVGSRKSGARSPGASGRAGPQRHPLESPDAGAAHHGPEYRWQDRRAENGRTPGSDGAGWSARSRGHRVTIAGVSVRVRGHRRRTVDFSEPFDVLGPYHQRDLDGSQSDAAGA